MQFHARFALEVLEKPPGFECPSCGVGIPSGWAGVGKKPKTQRRKEEPTIKWKNENRLIAPGFGSGLQRWTLDVQIFL